MWLIESAIDGWVRWRTRRLPVTPLDRVTDGARVKIVGRLDAGESPLEAPITGRACAAWSVEVQRAGAGWETIVVEESAREFVLRDGSARPALIRASRAHVVFDADSWSAPGQPSPRMRNFLARHRLPERRMLGEPILYRYVEGVLEPGEEITVVGVARLEIDPSGSAVSYREPPMRALLDAAAAPLWILDGPARWRLE